MDLLGAKPQGALGEVLQNTQCESAADRLGRLSWVSSLSTLFGEWSARGAHEAHPRSFQRFRRKWQLSELAACHRAGEAILVQVALPSEPTQASHVRAVRGEWGTTPRTGSRKTARAGACFGC